MQDLQKFSARKLRCLRSLPNEIDINRAEAAKERAEERIAAKSQNLDLKRAEYALHKALIRINVAGHK